jgi:asparagine synthase (glutamine-hydrolysing)
MIGANGFALFRGPEASRRAEEGMTRVNRFSAARLASSGGGDFMPVEAGLGAAPVAVVYSTGGNGAGLPVIHGFTDQGGLDDGQEPSHGEFSFLAKSSESYIAGRDALGTRPLYVAADGSIIASDHRFFPTAVPPEQLARGTTVDVASMKTRAARRVAVETARSLEESASRLARFLDESVERRVRGHRRVAVSFSGGLDSSLISMLAARHAKVTLCSAHASYSMDEGAVSRAADLLGLEVVEARLDKPQVTEELRSLDLPFTATPMDRALWCLYSSTARLASREGAEVMLLGQLADELFGGYMKYAIAGRKDEGAAAEMMAADVEASALRAFVRDEAACARFIEPRFPFADEGIVGLALGLPYSYKISGQQRKLVLRIAAAELGLPYALAQAPKKAAQYSSGIAKLVS